MQPHRIVSIAVLLLLGACSGEPSPSGPGPGSPDPVAPAPVAPDPGGGTRPATGMLVSGAVPRSLVPSAPGTHGSLVYVAASPASFPGAKYARLVSSRGDSTTARAFDGGFDPRSVRGEDGDMVTVTIVDSAGHETTTHLPARAKPPRVVRTSPTANRTDVPLNLRVTVVFSTPMDSVSVVGAVSLLAQDVEVPGTVELEANALTAHFTPSALLAANSDYELRVAGGVRDVLGTALEARVSVPFATGSSTATAGSIEFLPGSEAVALGDSVALVIDQHTSRGLIWGSPDVWSSSDPTIAEFVAPTTVQDLLWLRGLRPGVVTIRVAREGVVATREVQVYEPLSASVLAATSLYLRREDGLYRERADGSGSELLYSGVWGMEDVAADGRLAITRGSELLVSPSAGEAPRVIHSRADRQIFYPRWSPDGSRLAFRIDYPDRSEIWIVNTDGTGLFQVPGVSSLGFFEWHPDGTRLVVSVRGSDARASFSLVTVPLDGSNVGLFCATCQLGVWSTSWESMLALTPEGFVALGDDGAIQQRLARPVLSMLPRAWSADLALVAASAYNGRGWLMSADGSRRTLINGTPIRFAR
jgi:hypothetical protein